MVERDELAQERLVAFGERVRAARELAGLSQEALAHRSRLHRTYVGSVERGERNLGLINLYALADALNVDPAVLLTDDVDVSDALHHPRGR